MLNIFDKSDVQNSESVDHIVHFGDIMLAIS